MISIVLTYINFFLKIIKKIRNKNKKLRADT